MTGTSIDPLNTVAKSNKPPAPICDCPVNRLNEQIVPLLKRGGPREVVLEEALRKALKHFRSETGTIHRLDAQKQWLHLVAQVSLPPQLIEIVKMIPAGKGVAHRRDELYESLNRARPRAASAIRRPD